MSQTIDEATTDAAWTEEQAAGAAPLPPWALVMASGLYETPRRLPPVSPPLPTVTAPERRMLRGRLPDGDGQAMEDEDAMAGEAGAFGSILPLDFRGQLRLDVDGRYALMVASGTIWRGLYLRMHWIARMARIGPHTWTGSIFYRDGGGATTAYTDVRIVVVRPGFGAPPTAAVVRFSGGGTSGLTMRFDFRSRYAHEVEFEYDAATAVSPVTSFDTGSHPNRPASIAAENISIEDVRRRGRRRPVVGRRDARRHADLLEPVRQRAPVVGVDVLRLPVRPGDRARRDHVR
jgi:hypothetical protein